MSAKNLPLFASPSGYELLAAQLATIDAPDALLNGAVAIASHRSDVADVIGVDATLQRYADTIRARVRGSQPQAMLAHLHQFLFEEQGFRGELDDYDNPLNSFLPYVLETRRGLPITLSLVYKLIAERVGLPVWGVGLPGHFLCAVKIDGADTLIDPFDGGRELSIIEAKAKVAELFGAQIEWSNELLRPATNRHWLTRILQNLLKSYGNRNQNADVAAVLEMEMLLWPDQSHLQRDLGIALANCGLTRPASIWLDRYLKANPDDPERSQLQEIISALNH